MTSRRRLYRWVGWFALVNTALLAFLGHMGALACLSLLLLLPLTLLIPRPQVIVPLAIVLGGAVASLLLLDTSVFAENRYHLDLLTLTLFEPRTWMALALYFLLGLVVEAVLARWVWTLTALPARLCVGLVLALVLAGCFLASHVIHAWAEAHSYAPVTAFTRYLPLYFPLKDSRRMERLGLVNEARAREHRRVAAMGRPSDGGLRYPLAPLRCDPPSPRLNVLLVVIDGMRADALAPAVAPTLSTFAQSAVRFEAHFSGGIASRAGIFSLFYSLPATYWDAFADVARPPVLMDLFRKYDYQLGLFVSSPVYTWVLQLDRTVLARIPNLRLETISPYPKSSGRDRTLTGEWYDWLGKRDSARPFFGFLYYNAAVAFEPPDDYLSVVPVPPDAPAQVVKRARYLTGVHFIDELFRGVLDDLERRKLLDSTVIIVTSDHGMEFDENGLGFTGHNTAYSELQLHTPLLIRWPGRPGGRVSRRTSHFDMAPTLLTGIFGCTNPSSDYASGQDLFDGRSWEWLIAASHRNFALVEPDRVTILSPSSYEIRDGNYRLIPNAALPRDHLRAAQQEMRRFYQP
jgi:membrane-anchored protein YejM (alkaline phosphatase superfamily)